MRTLLISCIALYSFSLLATNLKTDNVRLVNRQEVSDMPLSVIFDVSWDNAWRNSKNHDAAWVFMKWGGGWRNHVKFQQEGHKVLVQRSGQEAQVTIDVPSDGNGFFIYASEEYRGRIDLKLQVMVDTAGLRLRGPMARGLTVHALEMVYVPGGPFTLGSPDESAKTHAAFYRSDDGGEPDGLYAISSEDAIQVGPSKGNLYYWSENETYNGDQQGPIPATFPKGYDAFYIMKYELTQGEYAQFLNRLSDEHSSLHSPIGARNYYKKRGSLRLEDGIYFAESPQRPMNQISFTDGLAYTDWAALRPVTELEFAKAARGPSKPIPGEFVWGTDNYDLLERYVTAEGELVLQNGRHEGELADDNRATFGASYYWVMDLNGSVWEKVITVGNEIGRNFEGSHGDGYLRFGWATNEDWPSSNDEVGGFGYRGGGYYTAGTDYRAYNPHSPIGYRYYGAWSGGPRSIAYGYRAGRSAE